MQAISFKDGDGQLFALKQWINDRGVESVDSSDPDYIRRYDVR